MKRLFSFTGWALLAAGPALLAGCGQETSETTQISVRQPPSLSSLPNLVTDTVRLTPLRTELRLAGQVTANPNRTTPVRALAGGVVEQVPVALGDSVSQGQVLAVIRSTSAARLEQEQTAAQLRLTTARQQLAATESMHADGLAADRDLAQARAELRNAQAEVSRVGHQRALLPTEHGHYTLRAPQAGIITGKQVAPGMSFDPDQTGPLFTLTDLGDVWVLADVFQADIEKVRVGLPAEITTLSYPDQVFRGEVDKVFTLLRPESRSLQVRVRLRNPGRLLKPGMYARVRLSNTSSTERLPAVPAESLVFANGRRYALVVRAQGTLETRPVVPGHTVGPLCYVREGLQPGERIVTGNPLLLFKALND